MRQFLLLMVAVAAFAATILNGASALKCYLQPGLSEENDDLSKFPYRKAKQMLLDVKDKMIETECPAKYKACIVAIKCHLNIMNIVEMENQDFRQCAPEDMCKLIPSPLSFSPFIGVNGGTNGDWACAGGCRACYTDLCNDKVEVEETTTVKNEENNNNNKEGGEGNGSSSLGSPPIAFALLLFGTITMVVVGTRHKMWMI